MHIERLSFAALGPFADEKSIDFAQLGGSTLFLIDGPTGAGKSTIIDAIVFALYGEVSGRGSDKQRLRSAFAEPSTESYVEIDFTTSSGRYRVRRTPEYERSKKRGEGVTTVASAVSAWRSTGPDAWEPVSQRKGEADAQIRDWVGLSRAQFLQTVVLPQGEFANFLAAESKDRLEVLERIFATQLYSRIEDVLDEERRRAEGERDAARQLVIVRLRDVISRLPDDHGFVVPAPEAPVGDADAGLQALLEQARGRAQADADEARRRQGERLAAEEAVAAVRLVADARARVDACIADVDRATVAVDAAMVVRAEHQDVLASMGAGSDDAATAVVAVESTLAALEHAVAEERRLPVDEASIDELTREVSGVERAIEALDEERDRELPHRLAEVAQRLSVALVRAHEGAVDADHEERRLVEARFAGMAAELAGALREGEPCVVCGSADHPSPARPTGHQVSAEDVAAAGVRRADAEARRHQADVERARIADLVDIPEASDGPATPLPAIRDEIDAVQRRLTEIAGLRSRAAEALAGDRARLESQRAALNERRAIVDAARGDYATVALRVAALRAARDAVTELAHAVQVVSSKRELLRVAEEEWKALVTDSQQQAGDITVALDAQRAAQRAAVDSAARASGSASLLTDLTQRTDAFREAAAELAAVETRTSEVISLAAIVAGRDGNRLAQPLSAFVVQRMFDEVLEGANRRLRVMLDGRFELRSTEERTGRALRGLGLGLEVRDLRTDSVRRTATLSGGESFCASLALALGLADTVRANAGGIELGMLFIDEGFGSLDADRLDEVMAELGRLQSDGRVVGVISHVSEMKRAIHDRIDVRPLGPASGSTLDVSWMTSAVGC